VGALKTLGESRGETSAQRVRAHRARRRRGELSFRAGLPADRIVRSPWRSSFWVLIDSSLGPRSRINATPHAMVAAHIVDATAAIARTDVGFSARGQCCGSDRIGIARCGQRRRGRDGDRLLGRRRLRAYRDSLNGLRHVGKLFRDRSRRHAVNGFRQQSKVVRDSARRCQQIHLLRHLICMRRRLGVQLGIVIKRYESRKRESGDKSTKYRLRGFHSLLTESPERNPVVKRESAIHRDRSPRYVPRKAIA
jgi:hypothetical protein